MRPLFCLLILTFAGNVFGQTLPRLILSETPFLDSSPDLAAWRNQHPGEQLKNAAYDNEYESQGLWCAASVAEVTLPGGIRVSRKAFFYLPSAKPGEALPAREDKTLVRRCRLLALWYEAPNPADPPALAKSVSAELAAALGAPEEPPRFRRPDGDWGSGNWSPYWVWERPNGRIVLAVDSGGGQPVPDPNAEKRLLLIARASQAPRGLSSDWNGEAPKDQPSLKPCAFDDGNNNWQNGLINAAEKLLPGSSRKSSIHLAMARAYATKLILTYPGVYLNGANRPTDPDALRRNAIAQYRAFLEESPNAPEASSAWRETWRLLAGLPPSPIHFACTD